MADIGISRLNPTTNLTSVAVHLVLCLGRQVYICGDLYSVDEKEAIILILVVFF